MPDMGCRTIGWMDVDRKGGDSLTTWFEGEVMENATFQGQVIGEEVACKIIRKCVNIRNYNNYLKY
jgi:hypothetical protein